MNTYLITQGERQLAYIEAPSSEAAIRWAKGISHVIDFCPSAPLSAEIVSTPSSGTPSFRAEYFSLLGFLE